MSDQTDFVVILGDICEKNSGAQAWICAAQILYFFAHTDAHRHNKWGISVRGRSIFTELALGHFWVSRVFEGLRAADGGRRSGWNTAPSCRGVRSGVIGCPNTSLSSQEHSVTPTAEV